MENLWVINEYSESEERWGNLLRFHCLIDPGRNMEYNDWVELHRDAATAEPWQRNKQQNFDSDITAGKSQIMG